MLLPCQQCLRANFFRITRCTGTILHNDRNYFTDPAYNLLAQPWRRGGERPQTLKLHCAPGTKVGAHAHHLFEGMEEKVINFLSPEEAPL